MFDGEYGFPYIAIPPSDNIILLIGKGCYRNKIRGCTLVNGRAIIFRSSKESTFKPLIFYVMMQNAKKERTEERRKLSRN